MPRRSPALWGEGGQPIYHLRSKNALSFIEEQPIEIQRKI